MKDNQYNLIDTVTREVIASNITLNAKEVATLNYAYATNGSTKRYFLVNNDEAE